LTLIEVLISMFVLLVGLLGVGTICQLGRLTLTETAKFDRAAACGRAALREVRIRRMLDVTNWRDVNGNQIVGSFNANLPQNGFNASVDSAASYCIDPVMIGQIAAASPTSLPYLDRFPALYPPVNPPSRHGRSMKRVTLGITPIGPTPSTTNSPTLLSYPAVASRIFSWRDDLAFDTSYVPKLRPQRLYRNINGTAQPGFENIAAMPYLPGPRTTPVYAETDLSAQGGGMGGYSWMVTVMPAYQEMPLQSGANAGALSWIDHHLFNVSVVVFYKRNLSLPLCSNGQIQSPYGLPYDQSECSERIAYAFFVNPPSGTPPVNNPTGYGGGDVVLTTPGYAAAPGDLLNIKRDDWLMLCCEATVYVCPDTNPSASPPTTINQPVVYFKWYRVVAVDDSNTSIAKYPNSRRVTLAGPDWPAPGQYFPNGIVYNNQVPVEAVLLSGIVGVYSDVVTLDSDRLWDPVP
jgi:hypothetical protein